MNRYHINIPIIIQTKKNISVEILKAMSLASVFNCAILQRIGE